MDLDYGSSSSLDMNCEVNFVCVMPIRLSRVRLTQCSCVDVSSLDLVIHGCTLYDSSSSRMSTRRLPVILFVSRFECTFYPVMYCLECLWWPRRFVINLRLLAYVTFVRATVALATGAATIPAPILLLSLRSAAVVAFFFPSFAIFALLWGLLVFLGILALFLGYTFGVPLFAPPVYSPLLSLLRWLA